MFFDFLDETSDAAWLTRIAGGDHAALAALYDRYAGVLLALCHAILGPSSEAEELLHDVFLDVWRSAARYQSSWGSVRAWLILRTREMALEQLRLAPELGSQGQSQRLLPSDWAPSSRHKPLALADRHFGHDRTHAQHALALVPAPLRTAVEGPFFAGDSLDDVAAHKASSREDAAARISRAYHVLHHRLHEPRRV